MIELINVSKSYQTGDIAVPVLKDISLHIAHGDFVTIMGPSGSGKSTLLNLIGCLDTVDAGIYELSGVRLDLMSEDELTHVRLKHMGFIFQSFNLIPRLSALQNVELPMVYAGLGTLQRRDKAKRILNQLGLGDRIDHTPAKLSGGQQQRVAIARALINNPNVIVADEPTGSLDTDTGHEIMRLFQTFNQAGKTIIMVTHEEDIAAYGRKIIHLKDGHLHDIEHV